ncbi:hypothetical protein DO97_12555 [Neosynechococcus sphagnicola sy1]|uniref:Uncharacterized protein n=1 Tax=Neosynechococcus sphagnicola sy1 TaxID=1497020 RepID=A0A098TP62_9CYAN|nr:hypothetical protein [Neosynechococcus sphagnicola]KGF73667.1 hypothetical protein DO97_12555 [Neosynechococcus sphagnicola sy1]
MRLTDVIQPVLEAGILTTDVESKINHLIWSGSANAQEIALLHQLLEGLTCGDIRYTTTAI